MYDTLELLAQIQEYEHALYHVLTCETQCPDCKRLVTSALNGGNRDDFREAAGNYCLDETCECDICGWWSSCSCHGPGGMCRND